ncbi:MAG TPA: protein kinase [Pyrinomonadaceae bacterium]|nr:protein kinase [Pyrinomonadaceae bacterium]
MSLAAGSKLGRYEIRSKIGEGGMGEVYLARDTQLDRQIAVKLLPAEIARDQQRLHRFLQEARAAAALSHPNIAHIYEIGEADDGYFIAMEFVEGLALDKKIGGRTLPIAESLDIAIQITDALDEAHSKGITHRDIKSSNIMIAPRGRVKVLDFGLAKVSQTTSTSEQISDSQLATRVKTSPGVVMGTVNYMSPEQASGKEVDARTDIWSVGVVLYEMVTGRLPFEGTTPSHIIVAILEKEPLPLSLSVPNVPEALEWIVTETLTKNREERTQTARELMKRLQRLKQRVDAESEVERSVAPERLSSPASGASGPTSSVMKTQEAVRPQTGEAAATPTHVSSAEYVVNQIKTHKTATALAIIVAIVVVAAVSFAMYKLLGGRSTNAMSLEAATYTRITNVGNATGAAISPDGKWLVHVEDDGEQKSLWLRQVAVANSNTQIVPPAAVRYVGAAFSPDGNYVYYAVRQGTDETGTLYQVPVLGGTPRKLFTGIGNSPTFSPDGKQMAYFYYIEDDDRLMIANADGTNQRQLASRRGDEYFFQDNFSSVSWSSDGKTIATPIANSKESWMSVATVSVATGEVRPLPTRKWIEVRQAIWFDDQTILATAQETPGEAFMIWRVSYPSGEATRLTNDLNWYPLISLTKDENQIAAVQMEISNNIWIMPEFDASRAMQITKGRNLVGSPAWTPDGKIIYPYKVPGGGDLYLLDPANGGRKQLTADAGTNVDPMVTPDGRYVVFRSDRSGAPRVWRMNVDGSDPRELTHDHEVGSVTVSPDGQWIAFTLCLNKCTVWTLPIDGGTPVQLTNNASENAAISPDGKYIACSYLDHPNGAFKLAIFSRDGGQPIKTFTYTGGDTTNKQWTPDGRAIVYGVTRGGVTNLWAQPIDGSPPKQLTNFAADRIFSFQISRDGKQVALNRGTSASDVVLISNFRK